MRKVDLVLLSQLKVEKIPTKIDFSAGQNYSPAIVQSTSSYFSSSTFICLQNCQKTDILSLALC